MRGLRVPALLVAVLLLAPVAGAGTSGLGSMASVAGGGLSAQQQRRATAQVRADTLSADSARARVLDRVRRLSAPPPADTAADTLDAAEPGERAVPGEPAARPVAAPDGRRPPGQPSRVGGTPADSIMEALMALPGYTVSRYRGDRVDFGGEERILNLYGNAEEPARFFREDIDLSADSAINYNEREGRVRTVGRNTFQAPGGEPVSSQILIFDLAESRGTALGARTRYAEGGAEWFVSGDLTSVEDGRVWGSHAQFTSCELEVPHSHFQTDQIKIVAGNVLVARSVTMYFADVPVFWLPFMAQSLGEDRGSGLLTPRFSVNDIVRTSTGYNRRISNLGVYWAMSDYSDAILAFDWWSGNYKAVTGNVRYNWLQQFLRGDLSFRQYWQDEGGTQLSLDTRNNWEYDERTRVNLTGRYASSSAFVRQNTFDPREAVQSITSTAGINRRFDWGNFSANANRNQYLSDDRVEMTLPTVNLSLSPITLFSAPPGEASWYNNVTWSGSSRFERRTVERVAPAGQAFSFSNANQASMEANANSSLNIGNLSWSQQARFQETVRPGVPDTVFPGIQPPDDILDPPYEPALRDLGVSNVTWSTSLSYRQRLIGTTSVTPRISFSGQALQSDTIPEALSFVSGPTRVTFGAGIQTDIFGFYPGFGSFSAIRHKMTPNVSYGYTPPTSPTALQVRVFGSQELQARSQITVGVNQTWEAKVPGGRQESEPPAEAEGVPPGTEATPGEDDEAEDFFQADEPGPPGAQEGARPGEPQRMSQDRIVNLLSLRTTAVTYDFVRADTVGFFSAGFITTRINNQISSDYLRGLSLSVEHDVFSDFREGGELVERTFAPHLSQLNLSFAVGSRTALFQRLFGAGEERDTRAPEEEEDDFDEEDDAFGQRDGMDELSVMPRRSDAPTTRRQTPLGEWNANLSYSLRRPRPIPGQTASSQFLNAQMVQATVSFKPTENWDVNWRTSYDIERGTFNDHMIRLSRDLHEWEASFDFRQTATGNWSFRFEVSLRANRDLKFDFEQRNLDGQVPQF